MTQIDCDNLVDIPVLPFLQELDCSYCKNLTLLPDMPSLQKLECFECVDLCGLPILMPSLKKLRCSGCNLPVIPKYPSIKKIVCYDCPFLYIDPVNRKYVTEMYDFNEDFKGFYVEKLTV